MQEWKRPSREMLLFYGSTGIGIGKLVGSLKCAKCGFHRSVYESWLENARTEKYRCPCCGSEFKFTEYPKEA